MDEYNELGVSALAQYVMHRKIILELFDRALSLNIKTEKYPLEKMIHNIIFPMKSTNEDLLYSQQNLWILDERLNYHSFIASDKQLRSLKSELVSASANSPDLVIFDRKLAFTEGEHPINNIIVVEFKRPQRDDYTDEDNPLAQCFKMVQEIRGGQFLDNNGRPVSVANSNIPAHCYVISDITTKLISILETHDATKMPDGQGYYGYHRTFGIYYEVLSYNKVLRDSQKRNKMFFDKLNIATANF